MDPDGARRACGPAAARTERRLLRSLAVSTPARYLLLGQIGFAVFLALCAIIDPTGLQAVHGWSYFVDHNQTLVPYVLAFATFIALTLRAARLLDDSSAPGFATGLRCLTVFLVLDVATPDTVNAFFYWAHDATSALLFLYELGFSVWIVVTLGPRRLGGALLVTQLIGGLVAMFSQLHVIPVLGLGILVFQLSFGLLLVIAAAPVQVFTPGLETAHAPANR